MPDIVGTAVETGLLGVLQGTLNGDTSILTPSARTFYDTQAGASVPGSFRYDGFVTKRGTLSVASPASGVVLTLQSSHEVAQFRAGDACFLVGNSWAGTVDANDNTADAVTVVSTSPVNQTVTVSAATRAGGVYSVGASLVVASASAPGAMVNSASAGAPLDNQVIASLLTSLQNHCNSTGALIAGGHTTTRIDVDNPVAPNNWDEAGSVIGATITFLAGGTAANIGCTAKVVSATVADPAILNLGDIKDADGESIAVLPATPVNTDTVSIELDLSEGKLGELGAAGGDYTRLVAAMLTMHRKLDEAAESPEIPLINEWNMWGQGTGTMVRMSAAYDNGGGGDTDLVLEWNDAAGDLPFPLSGSVRVIDAQDGVGSTAWAAQPIGSLFVPYTRTKRSNRLVIGVAALNQAYDIGCIVMLSPRVNGFAKTSGFSPEIPGKYLSGLLWQLVQAVNAFNILGT